MLLQAAVIADAPTLPPPYHPTTRLQNYITKSHLFFDFSSSLRLNHFHQPIGIIPVSKRKAPSERMKWHMLVLAYTLGYNNRMSGQNKKIITSNNSDRSLPCWLQFTYKPLFTTMLDQPASSIVFITWSYC
jgi:hypothetical protein